MLKSILCRVSAASALVLFIGTPVSAQTTATLLFDGAEPAVGNLATDFSFMGSNWSGGQVRTEGTTNLYASGLRSYHIDSGMGEVTFDEPVDSVTFFYVHDIGSNPMGTASAFAADNSPLGSANSNLATSFNDPANFVTIDPVQGISRIALSGGVVDNFSFTTLPPIVTPEVTSVTGAGFAEEGDLVTIDVQITGTTGLVTFAWLKDGSGTPLSNGGNVSGADTSSLTFDPVTAADDGSYVLRFTDSSKAITFSQPIALVVVPLGSLPVASLLVLGGILSGCVVGGAMSLRKRVS